MTSAKTITMSAPGGDVSSRLTLPMVLAVTAMVSLPALFCGIELCDSGFYLTFYENIFSDPASVEYNFMYWLTGVVGGAFMRLTGGGMLPMRLLGLLTLLATVTLLWQAYRAVVDRWMTAAAAVCVAIWYCRLPLTFSNDLLTLLMLTCGALLTARGVADARWGLILAGAVILGLNTWTRIPNVLEIGIGIVTLFSSRRRMTLAATFIAGWVAGLAAGYALMALLGQTAVFEDNIRTLLTLSGDAGSSHGLVSLIMAQVGYYRQLLVVMVKMGVLTAWTILVCRLVGNRIARLLLALPAAAYFTWMCLNVNPVLVAGALSFPGVAALSFRRQAGLLSQYARVALAGMIIFPLGSDGAGINIGSILYLAGLPLSLMWLWRRFASVKAVFPVALGISGAVGVAMICVGGLYFDHEPLGDMTATIDSEKCRGILVSHDRAEVVNSILRSLDGVVAPGDPLLAYGSVPMLNYLTSTLPYGGLSWPELVPADDLRMRLERGGSVLPVVVVQRFATIGDEWTSPDSSTWLERTEGDGAFVNAAKGSVIRQFINERGYVTIQGDNPYFEIYLPPSKQTE